MGSCNVRSTTTKTIHTLERTSIIKIVVGPACGKVWCRTIAGRPLLIPCYRATPKWTWSSESHKHNAMATTTKKRCFLGFVLCFPFFFLALAEHFCWRLENLIAMNMKGRQAYSRKKKEKLPENYGRHKTTPRFARCGDKLDIFCGLALLFLWNAPRFLFSCGCSSADRLYIVTTHIAVAWKYYGTLARST